MRTKLIVLAILFIMIFMVTFDLMAQSPQAKDHSKLQKSVEWANYQATWKKVELEKAKDNRKDKKDREKEAKKDSLFFAKLERIKDDK